jgi:hypothetical protein
MKNVSLCEREYAPKLQGPSIDHENDRLRWRFVKLLGRARDRALAIRSLA